MSTIGGWTMLVAHGMAGGAYSRRHNAVVASSISRRWSITDSLIGVGAAGRLTRQD